MSNSAGLAAALGACAMFALGLWLCRMPHEPSSERFALSPQECNTECQSRQTDCIDECEGKIPCEQRCLEAGKACVERCTRMGPDAGVAGAGGRPGTGGGGTAGAGGQPGVSGAGGQAGVAGAPGSAGAPGTAGSPAAP